MPARVQVVVEARDAASGILRGIASQMGAFGPLLEELTAANISWGNVAAAAGTAVIATFKDVMAETMKYAKEVRDLSLITGTGAEETSRLIQVMDDYEITAQDLTTATRFMTKNGLSPTVDTIAKLSDRYLSLNTAQERNNFILENFGRGGMQWVNLLNQGGDAIRQLNAGVSENLLLTDKTLQAFENYRLATDQWNDSILGLKISVGTELLPILADLMEFWADGIDKTKDQIQWWENLLPMIGAAHRSYLMITGGIEGYSRSQGVASEVSIKASEALEDLQIDYKNLISNMIGMQRETDRYKKTNEDLLTQLKNLDPAAEDYKAQFDEIQVKLEENEAAHRRWAAETVYNFALTKASVDGLSEAEGQVLVDLGLALGLFDEQTATAMQNVNTAFSSLDTENAEAAIETVQQSAEELTGQTWIVKFESDLSDFEYPVVPTTWGPWHDQGGPVFAGMPTVVGGAGPEPFFPARDGRILSHAESIHALTRSGGTNYFYGPVTLEISEEGGGGLLALR